MRTEQDMMALFDRFAKNDERIRLSVLEGSRTNPNVPKDVFQDYDISYFVTDQSSFLEDTQWLNAFGDVVFKQEPENMTLFPPELAPWYSYLMTCSDGIKIDLTLIPLTELASYFEKSDGLVKILLDKDHRMLDVPKANDHMYWLTPPTQDTFTDACNEFWHVSAYVVKGLKRREILYANDHINQILRPELLRMMAWSIGCHKGYHFSLGKNYKYLANYVAADVFDRLLSTYDLSSYEKSWQSFDTLLTMYQEYAKELAATCLFDYPNYEQVMLELIELFKERQV